MEARPPTGTPSLGAVEDGDSHWGSADLPTGDGGPAAAREIVRRACRASGVDDDVTAVAALLVTELVTNALLHAGGATRLTVTPHPSGRLLITVADGSPVDPTEAGESGHGGAGLQLLQALSKRWGVHATPPGKLVWFELDARHRAGNGSAGG